IQTEFMVSPEIRHNSYHVGVVLTHLTRNLTHCFPELHDEIVCAFNSAIPPDPVWKVVPVLSTSLGIFARTSNRFFVGLPLCARRNQEYLNFNVMHTADVFRAAGVLPLFPPLFRLSEVPPALCCVLNSLLG
ncbi:hypothetical protein FB451DRAFT_1035480, partial [Mycena latifolia]